MKDLSKILRKPPGLAVDPAVMARVRSEFAKIEQMGKSAKRGVVWRARVLKLQKELARNGYGISVTAKPSGEIDYDRIMEGLRKLMKDEQPKREALWVDSKEVCRLFDLTPRTLSRYIAQKKIPFRRSNEPEDGKAVRGKLGFNVKAVNDALLELQHDAV